MSEAEKISRASAEAVGTAMAALKRSMPEASEWRRVLMILGNAAASAGMLGIDREDVLALAGGAYENGSAHGPVQSLFD